jgi:prepilin-type N-terminal cleavage/methylation domain-containing protein
MIPNSKFQIPNFKNGFTFIEILAVISIISIALSIAIINGRNFNNSIELENTVKSIDAKIKLAKAYSIGARNGTNYGVHFESDKAVIFEGDTFIDGAPANETFVFSDKIEVNTVSLAGGGSDLIFDRLVGSTSNFGNIEIVVISEPSKTKQIIINSDGQTSLSSFQSSADSIVKNARHAHFNLGWNIASATTLSLKWVDGFGNPLAPINNINIASYLNAGGTEFDWTGTTLVSGVNQEMRIHSWLDESNNTVLCVMRKQTENKKLYIFVDGGAKNIAIYENVSGEVVVEPDFDGGIMEIQ